MREICNDQSIRAVYHGQEIQGRVADSRVKYGGARQYTVDLEQPVHLRWRINPVTQILITADQVLA